MLLPLRAALLAAEFTARVPTVIDPAALLDGDLDEFINSYLRLRASNAAKKKT